MPRPANQHPSLLLLQLPSQPRYQTHQSSLPERTPPSTDGCRRSRTSSRSTQTTLQTKKLRLPTSSSEQMEKPVNTSSPASKMEQQTPIQLTPKSCPTSRVFTV